MEPIRYVNIASFATAPEAHLARNELEAAGIPAQVINEAVVSALWYVGTALGGVKLMVAEKDVPAARKILAELELAASPIDESFDGYDQFDDAEAATRETYETPDAADLADANPYRSPRASRRAQEIAPGEHDADADEALANRIWRSAVLGLVFCPPSMNCYSLVLLLANLDLHGRLTSKHRWKLWAAAAINLIAVGMLGLLAWSIANQSTHPSLTP